MGPIDEAFVIKKDGELVEQDVKLHAYDSRSSSHG